jgi:hypothetical protein
VDAAEDETSRRVLDRMESRVKADLDGVDDSLDSLRVAKGVEVFNLDQEMLERCASLSYLRLDLKPFDQAILAAILVRAEQLRSKGVDETDFCELDSDLQPWDKDRNPKRQLAELYNEARSLRVRRLLAEALGKPSGITIPDGIFVDRMSWHFGIEGTDKVTTIRRTALWSFRTDEVSTIGSTLL